MRSQPMIVVGDVEAASLWFQQVLGLTSGHGGNEYEMLMDGDTLALQLHDWDSDDHPLLGDESLPSRGNGVLLWFSTDDLGAVISRAEQASATVLDGPLFNPNAHHHEIWLEGPDGYRVVVAGDLPEETAP